MGYLRTISLTVILGLILKLRTCSATFDLNIRELQLVSDHLTLPECRKLSEALHMHHFLLDHQVSGDIEPNMPCLDLLLHWDGHEGRGHTFVDLAIRLREIGHSDLAERLSRTVYHEKSEAVRESLLRDPFLAEIGHNSKILQESPQD